MIKMRKNLWMLTAFGVCVAMTMLTGCSIDDNEVVPSVEPNEPKEYIIEVGYAMKMPENKFLKVPATTDCDQDIVNALKAIDKVADVKAFKLNSRYDFYNEQYVTKTAYYFNYKQDIDHNDPSKGWFKQQCVLTVAGKDRPTVLHTQGYALKGTNNKLQDMGEPTLVYALEANCLQVEYRYFGWSLPEGYTNKWNYLSAKQHSDDLHAIVTAIKQSGIIDKSSKWLATGVSKNGMTTAHYAYYYPNEMDAYVPFCAPFLLSLWDIRPYTHILSKEAFDEDTEKLEKVKAAFVKFFSDKELQLECANVYKQKYPKYRYLDDENIIMSLKKCMIANHYPKMMYVAFNRWEAMIPKAGDSAEKYYDFIMANEKTKYPGETSEQFYRREELANDLQEDSIYWSDPHALTRAIIIRRPNPYYVQACKELGSYGNDLSWVEHLLTPEEKTSFYRPMIPEGYGVTYDNGEYVKEFLEGMKQSTCHMMFVYGMQDPWTGGQISDDMLGVNSRKLFIRNGTHNDYIDMWNQSEKAELFKWLDNLGFDMGKK